MPTTHTSFHKGYIITTRCSAAAHNRFEASFTVFPPSAADHSWQRFSRGSFTTAEAAVRDAQGAAMALVDQERGDSDTAQKSPPETVS